MSEEIPMNLDLNLGPVPGADPDFVPTETVILEDLIEDPMERYGEVRLRTRSCIIRQNPISTESRSLTVDLNQLSGESGQATTLQPGEGSLPAEEDPPKMCEPNNGFLQEEKPDKTGELEKGSNNDGSGSLFDCNICFDLATEPVVTCCGHLYCWPCLYQWLHIHSDAKECPVCKGELATSNLIPIYARGSSPREAKDPALQIPVRPGARRVEGLRQVIQRGPFGFPMEEMIRRASRSGAVDRTNTFLSRIMTFRGMRSEANEDVVDLTESIRVTSQPTNAQRLQNLALRRPHTNFSRSPTPPILSAYNSAERLVDGYLGFHPSRSHEQTPPVVDDRDSFSSVAAVINSESQLDAAVEIDSVVSLSTSSSRRWIDPSRLADLDTGDSRAPRRRRLN